MMKRTAVRVLAALMMCGMVAVAGPATHAAALNSVPLTVDFAGAPAAPSPPFVAGPQSGSYAFSADDIAPQQCVFSIDGVSPTDTACTLTSSGNFSMSICETGTVRGSGSVTANGVTLTFSYSVTMAGGSGPVVGSWSGGSVTGQMSFVPANGQQCEVNPGQVTQFTPVGQLLFNPA